MSSLLASPRARLATLAVLLLGLSAALVLTSGGLSQERVEDWIGGPSATGAIVYPLLYAVLTVLLVPGAVITAAGGALFGTLLGTALTLIGATAGATASFLIGRRLGRAQVERIAGRRIGALDTWLERRGLLAVLYVRLFPLFPFNALNYAAGVTALSTRDYVIGTAVGIVPGTFAYAALGSSLDDPTSPEFLAALGLVVLLAVLAPFLNRRLSAVRRDGPGERSDSPLE
ncbi:MAG: TVP38/TMEM64 family protein [Thermoleophilaceae bacterium]|nr:TVP38/TMEM64 family protein [Thermoleophilaceae bacterium]